MWSSVITYRVQPCLGFELDWEFIINFFRELTHFQGRSLCFEGCLTLVEPDFS